MNTLPRRFWGLLAVGAATAVGLTTHDGGFVVITLIGTLALPRILGFRRRHFWEQGGACGGRNAAWRGRFDQRMGEWHREAHERTEAGQTTA